VSTSSIALLEARLREHPEDGEGWLVYADWLLDQGDERGRLIQLEHRMTVSPSEGLRREIAALQKAKGWQPHRSIRTGGGSLQLKYGFVWGLTLSGDGMANRLRRLIEGPQMQFLTTLSLHDLSARAGPALAEVLPHSHVRTLRLTGSLDPRRLPKLLPGLGRLEALELHQTGLGDEGAALLAAAETLRGLRSLVLAGAALTDRGMAALEAGGLPSLRSLSLAHNGLTSLSAQILARAPTFSGLTSLDMGLNRLSDLGLEQLARSATLRGLRTLSLEGNPLDDDAAEAIASSEALQGLVSLNLAETSIGDRGVMAIARALPQLASLDARGLEVSLETREEIEALGLSAQWRVPSEEPYVYEPDPERWYEEE
jgi:uncharacterized protein (TIGR02996 family)